MLLLGGCATRPINGPITEFSLNKGYQYQARQRHSKDHDNLVILASGGGTRAAAFSYGVLELARALQLRPYSKSTASPSDNGNFTEK